MATSSELHAFSVLEIEHVFWLNPAKANAAGACPISLRLTKAGQRTEVSTGVRCMQNEWLTATHRLREGRGAHPEAKKLNQALVALEAHVVLMRATLPASTTLAEFRKTLRPGQAPEVPTTAPADVLISMASAIGKYPNAGTQAAVQGALRKLRCFVAQVPIDTRNPPLVKLPTDKLTQAYAAEFAAWLSEGNSARHCLALLRGLHRRAGLGPNPFSGVRAESKPAVPRPRYVLTTAQIQQLEQLSLGRKAQARARDIYLTQYYLHGSRVGVILELTWAQVDFVAGRVVFQAEKGGGRHDVALRPPLRAILSRYGGTGCQGLVFGALPANYFTLPDKERFKERNKAEVCMWQLLRRIGRRLGLPEGALHSHTARHSLATHTVQATGNVRVAQQLLGHSSVTITERYVRGMLPDELDGAADKVYAR